LCLDDFEAPWDQPAQSGRRAVELLLAGITVLPSVVVLVTMRGGERPKGMAWSLPMLPPLANFDREAAKRTWECLAGSGCDQWAEKLIDAVDRLPLAVTLLGSLAEVSTAEAIWERWQRENIAVVEREKGGDKLSSLEFSIALSLESGRMATDASSNEESYDFHMTIVRCPMQRCPPILIRVERTKGARVEEKKNDARTSKIDRRR
jgi:hypothetical protein